MELEETIICPAMRPVTSDEIVQEEEAFPQLRSEGNEVLQELATPFLQKRSELGLPMDAASLASASTEDELATALQERMS